jgi:hypothetical protein
MVKPIPPVLRRFQAKQANFRVRHTIDEVANDQVRQSQLYPLTQSPARSRRHITARLLTS